MTGKRNTISDEQFVEQMMRRSSTGVEPMCSNSSSGPLAAQAAEDAEVAQLRAALDSYRRETLLWAERRSAAQPSLAARARRADRWATLPRWALAAVGLVTLVGSVAYRTADHAVDHVEMASSAAAPEASAATEAELAADDSLLSSIDEELRYQRASPVDALRLDTNHADAHHTTGTAD